MARSISKAQAEALAAGLLDGFGSSRDVGTDKLNTVLKMLAEGGKVFLDNAAENLNKSSAVSTGKLITELTFYVNQAGQLYRMDVGYPAGSESAKYFDYIDKGVAGVESSGGATGDYRFRTKYANKKMANALLAWLKLNGAKATSKDARKRSYGKLEAKGKKLNTMAKATPSLESLAWATATAIKKHGIKKTSFFTNAINQSFKQDFFDALAVALATDTRIAIRQIARNGNNSK